MTMNSIIGWEQRFRLKLLDKESFKIPWYVGHKTGFNIEKVQHVVWLLKEVIYQKIFDSIFGTVLDYSFPEFYL